MFGNSKKEDLQRLETFVKHPYIFGTFVCQVFLILQRHYPLQFVEYMRKYRTIKEDPTTGDVVDRNYPHALKEVDRLGAALRNYLLQPPRTEQQQKEFNDVVVKLEDLFLRQNREN